MDEEAKKAAEAAAGAENGKGSEVDAFGSDNKAPVPPKDEGKDNKGKKFENIPDDHPTITALKKQIEDVKKEYGGNLTAQRDVIKRLEAEVETFKKSGGKKDESKKDEENKDLLFKDIKWSKDLTQEERDEMTETEIKQMDEIASMKEAQNKMHLEQIEKGKKEEEKKVDDLNNTVRSFAMELAKEANDGKENKEIANQIIEAVKMFDLTGLSEADVKDRIEKAAKFVPDYKAPKEQINKAGKPVTKNNGGSGDDPFGVDKIIEEATSAKDGNYAL